MTADRLRRLRHRRAELRRLPFARASDESHWIEQRRTGAHVRATLVCPVPSTIAYDVVLPASASVSAWCAVPEQGPAATGAIAFEISVSTDAGKVTARRVLEKGRPDRRWRRLVVRAPGAGRARIVFEARAIESPAANDRVALWGDPCIEAPRSLASIRAAIERRWRGWGIRGLLQGSTARSDDLYPLWVREHEPSRRTLRLQRAAATRLTIPFTLITFCPMEGDGDVRQTARSLQDQTYPHWEWIVMSAGAEARPYLGGDERVRVVGIPAETRRADAWNRAVAMAEGEFVALLDAGDMLAPTGLYEVAKAIEAAPDVDVFYSDEDRLSDRTGRRIDPRFKPDWSPELLLAGNYTGRLAAMRSGAVRAIAGFRPAFEPEEEWDLVLRLSRTDRRFRRITRCLYHRAGGRSDPSSAGLDALREHCRALGLDATPSTGPDGYRVEWPVRGRPIVSIVIPNRNAAAVLELCVRGLLHDTSYAAVELIIVDNGSTDPDVLELYRRLEDEGRGRVVGFDRPFNFSAACNRGAASARGELLLFLNNDIEVIHPEWLDELVRWCQRPEIGIVGAKLLYPDRTIQHAGVVFGLGLVGHVFSRAPEGSSTLFGSDRTYRNYLGVTGACQMMRRDVFDRLGGYDERFRLSFSDIVLCMEAWRAGYRVVYTPHARLVHHESYTRKREDCAEDLRLLVDYLQRADFVDDPYFHPELAASSPTPALRAPFDPEPRQVLHDWMARVVDATPLPAAERSDLRYVR